MNASLAGSLALSGGGAAVGAAISYNLITNTIEAYVNGSSVTSMHGGLDVSATSAPVLVAVAVGAAGGDAFALGGSLTINSIANTLDAHISNSTVNVPASVDVSASESAVMVVLSGGIAIAGGDAVGAAIAYNYIGGSFDPANPDHVDRTSTATDQVTAYIANSGVSAGGNITVTTGVEPPTTLASNTTFDPGTAVNTTANTIDVGDNSNFVTGQPVVYHAGAGNTAIGGLTDGQTYYVIVPAHDSSDIQLAATQYNALHGTAIPLTSQGGSLETQTLTPAGVKNPTPTTFVPGTAVNTTANTINVGNNSSFTTGEAVVYNPGAGNAAVGGLAAGKTYYVIVPQSDSTDIQLAATMEDADQAMAIHLSTQGQSTQQTLTPDDQAPATLFDPQTAVNTTADTINVGSNSGFVTGQPVVYHAGVEHRHWRADRRPDVLRHRAPKRLHRHSTGIEGVRHRSRHCDPPHVPGQRHPAGADPGWRPGVEHHLDPVKGVSIAKDTINVGDNSGFTPGEPVVYHAGPGNNPWAG